MLGADMALLSDAEIEQHLQGGGWRREDGAIVRDLSFEDFAAAIAFVDRVAVAAEAANHHPDVLVHGWNKVRLTLSHAFAGWPDRCRLRAGRPDRRAALIATPRARRPRRFRRGPLLP